MNRSIKKCSSAALLLCSLYTAGEPLTLTVTVSGIRSTNEPLGILLFNQADGFPDNPDKALRRTFIPAADAAVEFENLAPGFYAVSIFQDLNGNQRCDTNLLGIPEEPHGLSGDPRPARLFPRFNRARFRVESGKNDITIQLRH